MSYIQGAEKSNPKGIVYIKGNENRNKSRRISIDENNQIRVEEREDGVWNLAPLEVSPDTIKVGKGVSLSTIGSFVLKSDSALETTSITSEMNINSNGSETPKTSIWEPLFPNFKVQKVDTGKVTAKSFLILGRQIFTSGTIATNIHLRTASIGASADINFEIRSFLVGPVGTKGSKNLYFKKKYPASLFSPNTEIILNLGSGVSLLHGQEFSLSWESDEDFSLKGRIFVTSLGITRFRPWMQWDLQYYNFEELLSFPTGTDKILSDASNNLIVDKEGNIMYLEEKFLSGIPTQLQVHEHGDPLVEGVSYIHSHMVDDGVIEIS